MRKTLYPVTVTFVRTPRKGALAGVRIEDSIGHVDRAHAIRWIAAVQGNTEITEAKIAS